MYSFEIKKPAKAANTAPPRNPSIVVLGETCSNSLCFPMDFPTKSAKVSFVQIKMNKPRIIFGL